MSTRAITFLRQHRIPYETVSYSHLKKGAEFAAQAMGFPLEQTIKTLVVDLGAKQYALALLPGDRKLALKRLVGILGVKRVAMADQSSAERVTGYHVGGISPFGTKQQFQTIMEEDLLGFDRVMINGGQRGLMVMMKPEDIKKALGCRSARISDG